jgi:XTP/dITP diphosphohydrolase
MFSKVVLASGNKGKIKEFRDLTKILGWKIRSQSEFNVPEVEETGLSFVENAIIKARNAAKYSNLPALADDSGLEVIALNGEPGIYSARYAGTPSNDENNNALLLKNMRSFSSEKRQANFRCCLALVRHENDPCPLIGEGIWKGSIAFDEKGENGFGYDPLFIVDNLSVRSAELSPEKKNNISHRALAFQALLEKIKAFDEKF